MSGADTTFAPRFVAIRKPPRQRTTRSARRYIPPDHAHVMTTDTPSIPQLPLDHADAIHQGWPTMPTTHAQRRPVR